MITWITARLAGYLAPALIGAALLASLWAAHEWDKHKAVKAEHDAVMGMWAQAELKRSELALRVEQENRAEDQRRAAAQKEIADEADRKLTQARADAAIADAAAGRLQQRVAALITAAREAANHPETVEPGAPAGDPIGVLADVLSRADARAGLLGKIADERGAAGAACEREYDSLTPEQSAAAIETPVLF